MNKIMKFAFIFPGQGSQTIGMLGKLAKENSHIIATFHEASNILGYDLWDLVQHGPVEKLNKTYYTQPALLASSVAIYRIWQNRNGPKPLFMAGHSLGEYSALVCANVLSFTDAIKLVELRGKFMQEVVPEGTGEMQAIIGLDYSSIRKICEESAQGQIVSVVNLNSHNQIIIAGNNEAVKRASLACKAKGAKRVLPLSVSVPSHCKLMEPASQKLAMELEHIPFSKPNIPVINNIDVKCETEINSIRSALVRQLYNPVRWAETIEFISKQGVKKLFEIGPGKVLTGLTKNIVNSLSAVSINDPISLDTALNQEIKRKL